MPVYTESHKHGASVHVLRAEFAELADVLRPGYAFHKANKEHIAYHFGEINKGSYGRAWLGGCRDTAEIQAVVEDGWQQGAERALAAVQQIAPLAPIKDVRRRVRWAETGTELHIDRAMAGEWDVAWRNKGTALGVSRIVSLGAAFGGSCAKSSEQLFWTGAQLVVATDILENAGYRVEVRGLAACTSHYATGQLLTDVLVKRAGEPMRPDSVAAAFAHAGVFRAAGFGLMCASAFDMGPMMGVWDVSIDTALTRAVREELVERPDYMMDYAYSAESARANVERVLQTFTQEGT